jgi:hypothetical protein
MEPDSVGRIPDSLVDANPTLAVFRMEPSSVIATLPCMTPIGGTPSDCKSRVKDYGPHH